MDIKNAEAKGYYAWLIPLGALTAVGPFSVDMYLPAMQSIESSLHGKPGSMSITLSTYFIGMVLGQLFYGPISDRFGRKPMLYFGYSLYVLASVGCALASSVPELIVWRFFQGLGACVGMVIPRAMVRDVLPPQQSAQAFSFMMMILGIGPILAPWIGGKILTLSDWSSLFWLLMAFGMTALGVVYFLVKETHSPQKEVHLNLLAISKSYFSLLKNKEFMAYTVAGFLALSGMFAYIAGSPFVLIELYHVKPSEFGLYFGANAIGIIAVSQLNIVLVRRYSPKQVLITALWVPALMGIMLVMMVETQWVTLASYVGGLFIYVASTGAVTSNAMSIALASQGRMAGTASAMAGAIQFFLATLAGIAVSFLHDGTGLPLAMIMASTGVGAWFIIRTMTVKTNA